MSVEGVSGVGVQGGPAVPGGTPAVGAGGGSAGEGRSGRLGAGPGAGAGAGDEEQQHGQGEDEGTAHETRHSWVDVGESEGRCPAENTHARQIRGAYGKVTYIPHFPDQAHSVLPTSHAPVPFLPCRSACSSDRRPGVGAAGPGVAGGVPRVPAGGSLHASPPRRRLLRARRRRPTERPGWTPTVRPTRAGRSSTPSCRRRRTWTGWRPSGPTT